ncbi:hypothetical protein [Glutamicibacter sp. NPDC087344]|uniref:hypothetical protein n=1 Tax=Glutamicibacter sp. NPDC087344 TaxID=3363994 RepID=UPI00381AAA96
MTPRNDKRKTVDAGKMQWQGRLVKAQQFLQAADDLRELYKDDASIADAAVTLYVHAGIAAADALCAISLGKYAQGENHQDSVRLLATVDSAASKSLETLLHMKTRAGYGYDPISNTKLLQAERAARAIVHKASTQ